MSMSLIATILSKSFELFVKSFAGKLSDKIIEKLKGDPAKKSFKQAICSAIKQYAIGENVIISRPLLMSKGLLTNEEVMAELSKILKFDQEPNVQIIGKKWKEIINEPPESRDFTKDAQLFIKYFKNELKNTEVFRPVFEAYDINAISSYTKLSSESLSNIEYQIDGLIDLLNNSFGILLDHFANSSNDISKQIRDFTYYIEEKTRDFSGRQWVFDNIKNFIRDNKRGYFFIMGDPGIGKTALSAQLVKNNGFIHHFNIGAEGINKSSDFLSNVCCQLIAAYKLDYNEIPADSLQDSGFLNKVLSEVSDKMNKDENCIIVIDALDEVDTSEIQQGTNRLYLPITLPESVYIVVTLRCDRSYLPRVDCERFELQIQPDSLENLSDILNYIKIISNNRDGIRSYIKSQSVDASEFADKLLEKSEGNFMYLYYVLPEIEKGQYKTISLETIPKGLKNYYYEHWNRIQGKDKTAWFDYKLPIIMALTVIKEPISIDLIEDFSGVKKRSLIRNTLQEWSQFLHEDKVIYDNESKKRYRIYHNSFHEFIADLEEVKDERVSRKEAHKKIADSLWNDLYGDKD